MPASEVGKKVYKNKTNKKQEIQTWVTLQNLDNSIYNFAVQRQLKKKKKTTKESEQPWVVVSVQQTQATFSSALTVIYPRFIKTTGFCVLGVLLTRSPRLTLALAAVWKTWAGGGGSSPSV